ncbi:hypothetical protein C4D60_Mb11t05850 [Musa balbisiana]|uniref:Uncharacterized protein n=1 Tax=Musa balbisiana TaxID=52838 RepID=A0A4S8J237_MUSBA|nr:hypothetical protein C4D60_Mb11t05850 [Musa balbisiana]
MGDPGAASRRKNRLPKGGSESSDLHAAAWNGDLTTVESICNANPLAVNSRDRHSRTPYPFSLVLLSLIFAFVVVIMWWALRLVQSMSSKQLIAPPRRPSTESLGPFCSLAFLPHLRATLTTLHNRLASWVFQLDPSDA